LQSGAAMQRALLLAIVLLLLGLPLGQVESVAAASAAHHPLPTTSDFSIALPAGWTVVMPPAAGSNYVTLGAFNSPQEGGAVSTIFVSAIHADPGATWVNITVSAPVVMLEGGNDCTLDGVSGSACARYIVRDTSLRTQSLHLLIIKNEIVWHLQAVAPVEGFPSRQAKLEAALRSFHTDYGGPCIFKLGFQTLHELIPGIVGACTENEHQDRGTGNTIQATTNGLLVYRKTDNWTAFTDGGTTWINGPNGVESRPNGRRFCWEPDASQAECTALEEPEPQPDPAPPAGPSLNLSTLDGWATLVAEDGTYLGLVSSSQVSLDSICNPVGKYGSPVGLNSVRNTAGKYGSSSGLYSPYNAFSIHPPAIVYRNNVVGYLSKNRSVRNAVDPDYLFATYGCA
jgi:hypothetical protein